MNTKTGYGEVFCAKCSKAVTPETAKFYPHMYEEYVLYCYECTNKIRQGLINEH